MRLSGWKVSLRHRVNHSVPASVVNRLFLAFPFLYVLVNYESNLSHRATRELLFRLAKVCTLEGNVIECGSSRGGTTVIIAKFLRFKQIRKQIYACDSFVGFDREELSRERKAGLTSVSDGAFTHTSLDYIVNKAKRLGFSDTIVPVPGFFEDTLRGLASKWCLGFIDCDLHDSILYCSEILWPNCVRGGTLVFDDYACEYFRGARAAVDSFVRKHKDEISDHGFANELYYVCKA